MTERRALRDELVWLLAAAVATYAFGAAVCGPSWFLHEYSVDASSPPGVLYRAAALAIFFAVCGVRLGVRAALSAWHFRGETAVRVLGGGTVATLAVAWLYLTHMEWRLLLRPSLGLMDRQALSMAVLWATNSVTAVAVTLVAAASLAARRNPASAATTPRIVRLALLRELAWLLGSLAATHALGAALHGPTWFLDEGPSTLIAPYVLVVHPAHGSTFSAVFAIHIARFGIRAGHAAWQADAATALRLLSATSVLVAGAFWFCWMEVRLWAVPASDSSSTLFPAWLATLVAALAVGGIAAVALAQRHRSESP